MKNACGEKVKGFDSFNEGFHMRLDNGETNYGSYFGALLTFANLVIMCGFAYTKLDTLVGRSDVSIIESFQDGYFKDRDMFSAEDHDFFIAAALTHYDSNTEIIEKEEYGELLLEWYGWGNSDLGYEYGSYDLENHYCTDEDLGYVPGPNTVIYPIYKKAIPEVNTYKKKFRCVDNKYLKIWGDYNSATAMQISAKFHMCEGKPICKTEREIRDWISGMYIVLLYNHIRFKTDEFGEGSVIKEARIKYIPISSQSR